MLWVWWSWVWLSGSLWGYVLEHKEEHKEPGGTCKLFPQGRSWAVRIHNISWLPKNLPLTDKALHFVVHGFGKL